LPIGNGTILHEVITLDPNTPFQTQLGNLYIISDSCKINGVDKPAHTILGCIENQSEILSEKRCLITVFKSMGDQ
jgi:hypothetical protein